ncbi:hypothetical protein BH10CYA1_BH10CYA1_54160 [soil metagenome]
MCRIPGVYLGRGYGHHIVTSAVLTALHRYFVCDQSKSFSVIHRQALGTAFPLLPITSRLRWIDCPAALVYRLSAPLSGLAPGGVSTKVSCGSSKLALAAS